MKYLIMLLIPFIASCGNWLGVPEDIDVSGEVAFLDTKFKQVGSQVYVSLFAGSRIVFCFPVDPGTIYSSEWTLIEEAVEARMGPPTEFELINCL